MYVAALLSMPRNSLARKIIPTDESTETLRIAKMNTRATAIRFPFLGLMYRITFAGLFFFGGGAGAKRAFMNPEKVPLDLFPDEAGLLFFS